MDHIIVPMLEADLDEVLDLWRSTPGVGLNEADEPARLRAYLARNPGLSLVARDGRKLIGAVLCGHDGRRGYLNHLAVAVEYRNRGLGRRLALACLSKLQSLGIARCNIFLYNDNEPGERFWTHCGWRERTDLKTLQRPTAVPIELEAGANPSSA